MDSPQRIWLSETEIQRIKKNKNVTVLKLRIYDLEVNTVRFDSGLSAIDACIESSSIVQIKDLTDFVLNDCGYASLDHLKSMYPKNAVDWSETRPVWILRVIALEGK